MYQATVTFVYVSLVLFAGYEKVENAFVVDGNLGVTEMTCAVARGGSVERIWLLFGKSECICACGIAQLFAYTVVCREQTCGIEGVEFVAVAYHGACAYGLLPVFIYADGNGMVGPCLKVACCTDTPLMAAKSVERGMVAFVE